LSRRVEWRAWPYHSRFCSLKRGKKDVDARDKHAGNPGLFGMWPGRWPQVRLEAMISPTARPNGCVGRDDALTHPTPAEQPRHGLRPPGSSRLGKLVQQVRRLPPTPWYDPAGRSRRWAENRNRVPQTRQAARSGRRPDPSGAPVGLCQRTRSVRQRQDITDPADTGGIVMCRGTRSVRSSPARRRSRPW